MKINTQFCQKCQTANAIGEPNCLNCGTRLMIVTFPASYKHDEPFEPSYYEQFLLEKISLLELQVSQMADSMRKIVHVVEKSQQIFEKEHNTVEKIFDLIEKINFSPPVEVKEPKTHDKIYTQIIAQHDGKKAELFKQLVKDGFKFHSQNEEKQSLGLFERAVEISPKNIALLVFLGKILFEQENKKLAETYLKKAHKLEPTNEKVLLLSATIFTESEHFNEAKLLLSNADSTFCNNFIKGFIFAAEEDWTTSLIAFKECLNCKNCAETNYLVGCVYYQSGQFELAQRQFQIAVETDENFADAWFMTGKIYSDNGDKAETEKYIRKAMEAKDSRSKCYEFLNGKKEIPTDALPFVKTGFFLKGAKRLSELFKTELDKMLNV